MFNLKMAKVGDIFEAHLTTEKPHDPATKTMVFVAPASPRAGRAYGGNM